ncbi:hypothetical protein SCLARK_00926 [Spiroplasma clarkii]|uniref:Spiralin n=1 Tax=Spiroplasma clarkii TaxID=2139 RepID=A0A1Y0L0I8_9MOLU|nr:lipoprotein [Spiroplasma clarkii]ARU91534.1 hypothetical protein SCLARK_00926 [Spiroplasma clarkii]ATX70940.1 hypothetical protein SCLAR_v1c06210 [Spiroplasma clarkii]
MKKLLGLLAATGLVASTGATVVACGETVNALANVTLNNTTKSFEVKDVTIPAFVTGKANFAFESNAATGKSILVVEQMTNLDTSVLKSNVKISLKAGTAKLAADVTEIITVKYNDAVIGTINVTIKKDTESAAVTGTITNPGDQVVLVKASDRVAVTKEITITTTGTVEGLSVSSGTESVATATNVGNKITISIPTTASLNSTSKITVKSATTGVEEISFTVTVKTAGTITKPANIKAAAGIKEEIVIAASDFDLVGKIKVAANPAHATVTYSEQGRKIEFTGLEAALGTNVTVTISSEDTAVEPVTFDVSVVAGFIVQPMDIVRTSGATTVDETLTIAVKGTVTDFTVLTSPETPTGITEVSINPITGVLSYKVAAGLNAEAVTTVTIAATGVTGVTAVTFTVTVSAA